MLARRQPVCITRCFGFKSLRLEKVTVGGQFCRRPMRAAFKRRYQGGVLLVCFFLVMDVRKKIAQRPVGQIKKQQADADLDAAAYNHTPRRRQSAPLRSPRQRAALKSRPAFVPSTPSRNHPPWLYLAGSLARSRSPVRSRQTPSLTVGMTQWRSPLWTQIGVLALLTCRFRPYNEVMHPNKYIREALDENVTV
jgi:hypothetical protein